MMQNNNESILYKNARIIDPKSSLDFLGHILINEGIIVAVEKSLDQIQIPTNTEINDLKGLCVSPGLVDMRVQIKEPGEEHKESILSALQAAVAGGVTSLVCLPNTNPVLDDQATIEFIKRRADTHNLAKVYTYGAATKGLHGKELAEIGLLNESGAVAFTDGIRAISNSKIMHKVLSYASTFNLLIIQHPEEPSLSEGGVMNAGEMATRLGLTPIPREAEIIMLERDIRLVEMTDSRYHAAHISTSESVEIIRRAKKKGLKVTCDTSPFYFSLNEIAVGDYRTFSKLSPPLRNDEDRQAIIEGLKDDIIDVIASDHSPQDQESKRLPFSQAAFGGSGLETLLAISLDLYHNGHLSLLEVLSKITINPSKLLNLDSGTLNVSAPADIIIFDPEKSWKIIGDNFISKSKNTPFDGRPTQGKIITTIITILERDRFLIVFVVFRVSGSGPLPGNHKNYKLYPGEGSFFIVF